MKLIIDIPESVYDTIESNQFITRYQLAVLQSNIRKGVPLPKGHGRLIDADALKKYIDDCDCCVGCEDESFCCSYKCKCPDYLDKDMERIINNQSTIIEADTESEE